jgi:uncharacterized membrane protein
MTKPELFGINIQQYSIGFACLLFGYLFKVLIVFNVVTGDGYCLHTFWLGGSHQLLSPFFLTLGCVLLFFAFGVSKFISLALRKFEKRQEAFFYFVLCVVTVVWLHGLFGLWRAFEYEKGNIAKEDYFSQQTLSYLEFNTQPIPHKCSTGN